MISQRLNSFDLCRVYWIEVSRRLLSDINFICKMLLSHWNRFFLSISMSNYFKPMVIPPKTFFEIFIFFIFLHAQRWTLSCPFASAEGLKFSSMLPFTSLSHKNFPFAFGLNGEKFCSIFDYRMETKFISIYFVCAQFKVKFDYLLM